ncbi:MAG: phospholipid ABC transporter ATP-binding protein MlaF [Legionellales bacterium]|nr:phospholipid ABC transporter ATP-binding protein MlaF [Legionellales bacterium]|tara:strand:- start:1087 stop:1911 length:825 start_codon:yes stop_codon:yes gene_type:complete
MSADSENLIEIKNVHFKRGSRVIFDGVDINIPKGKVTAIMGPSGTGKTTLLRLIGAQLEPDQGHVFVDNADIHSLSRDALYHLRRRMGMLFQSGALFTDMSVFDNVAFPIREHTDLPEEMIHDIVLMKLQAVGLRGAAQLHPSQLSGGMSRRVALARAIALDPELIMYDEPFAGQDPISMAVLVQLVRLLNDALGLTSVIVSHDVQETIGIADYAYVIAEGKVIGHGSPETLANHKSDWVQQFIQGLPDGPVPFHYPAGDYKMALLGSEAQNGS